MYENEITEHIIGCAINVHNALGPGFLESAYEACLYHETIGRGLSVERQTPVPLIYKEVKLDCGYRADLMMDKKVIVEVKAVDVLNEIHFMQLLTHLRLTNCKVGLLINFNVLRIKDGIKRVVNKFEI